MPKISIIIPVHNSEKYIGACVESVQAQTFSDFELLLMENGSKDNTYNVAKSYADKDNRIKLFKLTGKGICYARNCGLDEAQGEYIVFMDNDDIVTNDHLQALYDCVKDGICNMAVAPVAKYYPNKTEVIKYRFDFGLYSGSDKCKIMGERVVWSRIYLHKLIKDNNVRFDTRIETVEDWPFYVEMLLVSGSVRVTDKSCYMYRLGRDGQASRGISLDKSKRNFIAVELVENLLRTHNVYEEYRANFEYEFASEVIGKTFGLTPFKKLSRKEVAEIIEPIKEKLLAIKLDKTLAKGWQYRWFVYFQRCLKMNCYRSFFKVMRFYRNIILQPFGIKYK